MLHALALAASAYLVQSGDTLSGIAASNGVSLSAIESANPQISNPDVISVGESVNIPGGSSSIISGDSSQTPSSPSSAPAQTSPASSGSSSGSLSDVPGVPSSFAACVAFRESTNGQLSSNIYGITPGSGYSVAGMSPSQQKQVFAQLYAAQGTAPWGPFDGC